MQCDCILKITYVRAWSIVRGDIHTLVLAPWYCVELSFLLLRWVVVCAGDGEEDYSSLVEHGV